MTSNLFGPPKNSGDRAARRAIKDVHRYADLLGREHEEAVTGELNCNSIKHVYNQNHR